MVNFWQMFLFLSSEWSFFLLTPHQVITSLTLVCLCYYETTQTSYNAPLHFWLLVYKENNILFLIHFLSERDSWILCLVLYYSHSHSHSHSVSDENRDLTSEISVHFNCPLASMCSPGIMGVLLNLIQKNNIW